MLRIGRGEPIVLVPGIAGGGALLLPLARRLARHHQVFVVELPGDRGGKFAADRPEIDQIAADLGRTIERLGLERPTLFGVSFGALVSLQLCCDQPNACGRLVLYGADRGFQEVRAAQLVRHVLERFPLPHDHPFLNQFFNVLFGGKTEPSTLRDFVIRRCWETEQAVVAHRLQALESFDLGDRARQIDAPTLLIAGLRDVLARPRRQEALARSIPDARFRTIEGAGHVGFLTHRVEVARLVRAFIGRPAAVA